MAGEIRARELARRLVGRTIPTIAEGEPNTVVRVGGANVFVRTAGSAKDARVPLNRLQAALDLLVEEGEVRISPTTFNGFRRFSFLGAALAQLHGVQTTDPPTWVRLAAPTLQPALEAACAAASQARDTPSVDTADPFYALMSASVNDAVAQIVDDEGSFKVQGQRGGTEHQLGRNAVGGRV